MGTYEAPGAVIDKRFGLASAAISKGTEKLSANIKASLTEKAKRDALIAKQEAAALAKSEARLARENAKKQKDLFDLKKKVGTTIIPPKTYGNFEIYTDVASGAKKVRTTKLDADNDGKQDTKEDLQGGMGQIWVEHLENQTNLLASLPFGTPEYNQELANIQTILELGNNGNGIVNKTVQNWEDSFVYDSGESRMIPKTYATTGASLEGQSEMQRGFNIAYSNGGVINGQRVMEYVSNGSKVGLVYKNPYYDPSNDPSEMKELFINYNELLANGANKGYTLWDTVDVDTFDKKIDQQWDKFSVDYNATTQKIVNESATVKSTQTLKSYDDANQALREKVTSPQNVKLMPIDQNFWQLLRTSSDEAVFDGSDAMRNRAADLLATRLIETKGKQNSQLLAIVNKANNTSSSAQAISQRATVEGIAGFAPLEGGAKNITTNGNAMAASKDGVGWGEADRKYTVDELDKLARYYANLPGAAGATELGKFLTASSKGGTGNYVSGAEFKRLKAESILDSYNSKNSTNITNPSAAQVDAIVDWGVNTGNAATGDTYLPEAVGNVTNESLYNAKKNGKEQINMSKDAILKAMLDQVETPANAAKILNLKSALGGSNYIAQETDYETEAQNFA